MDFYLEFYWEVIEKEREEASEAMLRTFIQFIMDES